MVEEDGEEEKEEEEAWRVTRIGLLQKYGAELLLHRLDCFHLSHITKGKVDRSELNVCNQNPPCISQQTGLKAVIHDFGNTQKSEAATANGTAAKPRNPLVAVRQQPQKRPPTARNYPP